MDLNTPISKLFMVGSKYARRLKKLDIETIEDLLYHFPHRYEDRSLFLPIKKLEPGKKVTVQGKILSIKNEHTKKGKKIQKGIIADPTGQIQVTWFNQPYLVKVLKPKTKVNLFGKIKIFGNQKVLVSPEYEEIKKPKTIHTGRLVPVYPETAGVSSKWLRSRIAPLIKNFVPRIGEFLPNPIIKKNNFLVIDKAIKQIHFPQSRKKADHARQRFAYEEFFLLHIKTLKRKKLWKKQKLAYKFKINQSEIAKFIDSLPFELTSDQKKATQDILKDFTKNEPMNRLLEGDVGSGKTVVSAIAVYAAFLNNCQTAYMAPTEILANQHYQTLKKMLAPFKVKISLLTGSTKKPPKLADVIVGTHALIHKRAKFEKLGFVVIDEQQRFGVEQRGALIKKTDSNATPHFLTTTATPIPRTIALTMYGDLDLSYISQLPPGRIKIKTWVVPNHKRKSAYNWIKEKIADGDQAFIICPLIEKSNHETMESVKAAKSEFKKLKEEVFSNLNLGLLHGRMKSDKKEQILTDFQNKKIDILISTPVVEVGIDITNATIMVIETANRFGLAQLHQLRGRVGRGKKQSYCLLFSQSKTAQALKRLKAMEKNLSGAELAEIDLKMRGPGVIYGTKQHGFIDLKIASFSDYKLIKKTKKDALRIVNKLSDFPALKQKLKKYTIKTIEPN